MCHYRSDSKDDVIQHVRIHLEEKPFKCKECSETFRYQYQLRSHMRNHTGERPFTCTLCPLAFKDKSALVGHIKKQHPMMYNASSTSVTTPSVE